VQRRTIAPQLIVAIHWSAADNDIFGRLRTIMVINSSKTIVKAAGFNRAVTLMRFNHPTLSCVPSG
jgi:hypothetical protein